MLDDVIRFLACPYCDRALCRDGATLRCPAGHAFDVSRQGYVSLLPAGTRGGGGDTAAMIRARAGFLDAGHYAGLAAELASVAGELVSAGAPDGCVIDAGAGTGYYLAAVLDRLPDRSGLALDLSKSAARRAAGAHPRIGAVACDVWRRWPVGNRAAVAIVNVFAPRNAGEFARALHPAGHLLVVTPAHDHLGELISPLGLLSVEERKDERLAEDLSGSFRLSGRREYRASLSLSHGDLAAVVGMGPSAWHLDKAELERHIEQLPDPMRVTVSATISTFAPSPSR